MPLFDINPMFDVACDFAAMLPSCMRTEVTHSRQERTQPGATHSPSRLPETRSFHRNWLTIIVIADCDGQSTQ